MTLTLAEFRVLYPELEDSPDALIEGKMLIAEQLILNLPRFNKLQDTAIGLMTAHLIYLHKKRGETGNAIQSKTSKKVGDVQFSMQVESGSREWYSFSGYGQELLMMIDNVPKLGTGFVA